MLKATTAKPGLFQIGAAFLLTGCLAFGGQGGLLALLNRDLVEGRRWVTEDEITEAFTYVQILPGAVVVQVVAYLGWKLRRAAGVAVATSAFLLPSVVAMLVLAAVYQRLATMEGVAAALGGLTATTVGLLTVGAARQARKTVTGIVGVIIAASVCAGSVFLHLNPALMILLAGSVGLVIEVLRGKQDLTTPVASRSAGSG